MKLADARIIDNLAKTYGADNLAYRAHAVLVADFLELEVMEDDEIARRFVLAPGNNFFRTASGNGISTVGRSADASEESYHERLSGYGGAIVFNTRTREIREAFMPDFIAAGAERAKIRGSWNDPRISYKTWESISARIGFLE